jgi:hypothetical protein
MRAFIDLSLKFAPHEKIKKDYNIVSWEARYPSTSGFSGWPSASLG